jgi:hypothetical protein
MKKVYVIQPMNGLSDDEIKAERAKAKAYAEIYLGEEVELIESFFEGEDGTSVGMLGRGISMMGDADLVVIMPYRWGQNRGCSCEEYVVESYDLPYLRISTEIPVHAEEG